MFQVTSSFDPFSPQSRTDFPSGRFRVGLFGITLNRPSRPFSRALRSAKTLARLVLLGFLLDLPILQATTPDLSPPESIPDQPIHPEFATRFSLRTDTGAPVLQVITAPSGGTVSSWHIVPKIALSTDRRNHDVSAGNRLELPLRRVAVLSTTFLAHFSALDATDAIVAVDNASYACDEGVRDRIRKGKIRAIGELGTLDVETLIALKPDALIVSAGMDGQPARKELISRLGIPVIEVPDYLEPHPLGRAEWIRFFGVLLDRQYEADHHFAATRARYLHLQQEVVTRGLPRPRVLINAPFQGLWYLPAGDSFASRLITDAGGDYAFANLQSDSGAKPFDLEWVLEQAHDADIWLSVGDHATRAAFAAIDPRFRIFKAFAQTRIYSHFKRKNESGGNDIYESGVIRPDRVLEDLVLIFGEWADKSSSTGKELYYHIRLP